MLGKNELEKFTGRLASKEDVFDLHRRFDDLELGLQSLATAVNKLAQALVQGSKPRQ